MNFMVDHGKDVRRSSHYDARFEKPIKPQSNQSGFEDVRKPIYYDARFGKPTVPPPPPSNKSVFEDGGTSRPRFSMEDWSARRNDAGIQGSGRDCAGRMRFLNFPYRDDQAGYDPSYIKRASVNHCLDKINRVDPMRPDEKDELLKKIDELKEQIIRSCDIAENPRQRFHNNRMMMPTPMHTSSSSSPSRTSHYATNSPQRHVPQSYYGDYNRAPLPSTHNFREHDNYRAQFKSSESPQYTRRNFDANERKTFPHEVDCSCLKCYVDNWQIPSRDAHSDSKNKRASIGRSSVISDSLRRGQSKNGSDIDSLIRQSPMKKRVYKPIVGGAPFILCTNCFELLKLPRKAVRKGRTEHQVSCGSCSSINVVGMENNGLVPLPTATNQALTEVVESSGTNGIRYNHAKHETKESCSLDFDNSSCNFHLTDTESSNIVSVDDRSNLGGNDEKQDECASSSSSGHLVDDQKTDISNNMNDLPCSPLKHVQDCSSSDYILGENSNFKANSEKNTVEEEEEDVSSTTSNDNESKCGEGSQKESNCQEGNISHENLEGNGSVETVTLNPEKDASMPTEIDDSFADYSNVSDAGFDKNNQRDHPISNSIQSVEVKQNVFVNGQLLADHVVKRAEVLAGPIQPGNYWYDFQAGFWGVIGHPCLGIIPPFIDQFSSPMAERCASGNTGIYVNGRELHDRDLDLLASRGLPSTRNKYYVVLFSGRVFDKYSGEELTCLGKLAPSVDRQKRGFGMQVPRFLAN